MIKTYLLFCFLGIIEFGFSQNQTSFDFKEIEELFDATAYDSIIKIDEALIMVESDEQYTQLLLIYAESFEYLNQDDKALKYYKKLKDLYYLDKKDEKIAYLNYKMYFLLDSQKNIDLDKQTYLNDIKAFALKSDSKKWEMIYYNLIGINFFRIDTENYYSGITNGTEKDSAKHYFKKALNLSIELDTIEKSYDYNINLGAINLEAFALPDSAILYYKNAEKLLNAHEKALKNERNQFDLYNNLGKAFHKLKDFEMAKEYYDKAKGIELQRFNNVSKMLLYYNIQENYFQLNEFEKAYTYLNKYDSINFLINTKQQNTNITEIEEKYENEKLRADNLESESKRIQNRNIAIGLGGGLSLISVIGFLYFNNKKKKQEIQLQNQVIAQEQLKTKLKDEELKSVDAMIEGQEKERLNIANELHDELGSLMATIKMHFESIQTDTSDQIYTKTNTLIENAYQKIRNISHSKNSGVLANKGLLKAIKDLAKTSSVANRIQIDVYDNGLDQRISNSVELTLFRILQELITNILKHAQASNVEIYLNMDDEHLNIMVEDNGVGFDTEKINNKQDGIGLRNIEKRIENLGGQMVLESKKGKGTSVILDIPL